MALASFLLTLLSWVASLFRRSGEEGDGEEALPRLRRGSSVFSTSRTTAAAAALLFDDEFSEEEPDLSR